MVAKGTLKYYSSPGPLYEPYLGPILTGGFGTESGRDGACTTYSVRVRYFKYNQNQHDYALYEASDSREADTHQGLREMIMARTPRSPMGHHWKKSSAHTKSEGAAAADALHAVKKRRPDQALSDWIGWLPLKLTRSMEHSRLEDGRQSSHPALFGNNSVPNLGANMQNQLNPCSLLLPLFDADHHDSRCALP